MRFATYLIGAVAVAVATSIVSAAPNDRTTLSRSKIYFFQPDQVDAITSDVGVMGDIGSNTPNQYLFLTERGTLIYQHDSSRIIINKSFRGGKGPFFVAMDRGPGLYMYDLGEPETPIIGPKMVWRCRLEVSAKAKSATLRFYSNAVGLTLFAGGASIDIEKCAEL